MTEKTRKTLHSSKKDDWGTPKWLFDELHEQYNFTLDLCARKENALLPRFCENIQSGMLVDQEWSDPKPIDWDKEVFFCNPPYGRQLPKILNAIPSYARGVLLLPARTGSKWFVDIARRANVIYFLSGRLTFQEASFPAPFDSVLLVMGIFNKDRDLVIPTVGEGFLFFQQLNKSWECLGL